MKTGTVYAVASGKGGVGKTTTAVNLGAAFVEAGRSVVVVDVDLGMANLGDVLTVERPAVTLHDVLAGEGALEDAIVEAPGEFDVVLGSDSIEDFGTADPAGLREVVESLREQYDVVVLDGGGGLSHDMTVPLGLADSVILVSTPTDASITNAKKTQSLVERLDGSIEGAVITRLGGAGRATPETVGDRLGTKVLGSVPEDGAIKMSADEGTPLVTIDRESPAAQSYREIAYGLLEEPLPRDWAEDDGGSVGGTMASAPEPGLSESETEPGPAEPETEESETADPVIEEAEPDAPDEDTSVVESGAEEMGEHPQEGIAETLESMETGEEDDASAETLTGGPESESTEEEDKAERGSFLSRLFGGLFG